MRVETLNWTVCGASHIGHYHVFSHRNNQDAYIYWADPLLAGEKHDRVVAFVSDGCGEGEHSEVGAKLLVQFLLQETKELFRLGWGPQRIAEMLFRSVIHFINSAVDKYNFNEHERALHIKDFWSATILGVVIDSIKGGVFFHAGDGLFATEPDSKILRIDQNNFPNYISYNCLEHPEKFGVTPDVMPTKFEVIPIDLQSTQKIMISTDGFETRNETAKVRLIGQKIETPNNLHGDQWDKKGNTGLSRWMNVRFAQGFFEDDCTIITIERKNNENGN